MKKNISPQEKDQKVQHITECAEKIFYEKGFEDTSMDYIAMKADVAKGTLYLYFTSKKDLYYAVVLRGLKKLEAMIVQHTQKFKTGFEKTYEMARMYIEFFYSHREYYEFIVEYESHRAKDAEVNPFVRACYKESGKLFDILCEYIAKGKEDKSIKESILPQKDSLVFWIQTVGLLQQLYLKEKLYKNMTDITSSEIIERHIEMIASFLKNGSAGQEG